MVIPRASTCLRASVLPCFHLPPCFWPMGDLGISSVPHLTITSPRVNRLCSSRWNNRRCQSTDEVCCFTLINKLIIGEPGLSLCKADHKACNKQVLHSDPPCTPRSYLHDNQPERPTTSWLVRNLTWPTAGRYHSKPFFLYQTPWVCHCPQVHANCRLKPSLINPYPGDSNPGPLKKTDTLPLWAIQTTMQKSYNL